MGARLARLSHLEYLEVRGHGWLEDQDVEQIATLPRLLELRLPECSKLSSHSLRHIGRLHRLVRLDLDRCYGIEDAGLERLNELESLTELDLRRTQVRGPGLARLGLEHLRRLSLRGCSLSRVPLRSLPALATLDLAWCEVDPGAVHVRDGVEVVRSDSRICMTGLGGQTPVQGFGEINGIDFYFRARHRHWSFTVGPDHAPLYEVVEQWGDGPFDAGYMPIEEAERLIGRCADDYLAVCPESKG